MKKVYNNCAPAAGSMALGPISCAEFFAFLTRFCKSNRTDRIKTGKFDSAAWLDLV